MAQLTRKFNGKVYRFRWYAKTKTEAQKEAARIRHFKGEPKARIVHNVGTGKIPYSIYVRRAK